jgi:CubicO group peptidase (beta-lactamase class C family)
MKKLILILALVKPLCCVVAQKKEFDRLVNEQFRNNEPGATVLVARKGQVIYKKAGGMSNLELAVPMKTDNVFRIGSITKQFTAIAILQLMEQGKLNLTDELTKYIPDYPVQGNKITIEHLLTHTSGIWDYSTIPDSTQRGKLDFTPQGMIDYFKKQPIRFAPAIRYEYSNSGYFLLGFLIEKISGKTYAQYLEENFFKPIGMNNSRYAHNTKLVRNRANGYTRSDKDFENAAYLSMTQPYAAGSILSTVEDLFKWQQALISYKLVKKETLIKAWSEYKLSDGTNISYGYGWRMGFIQDSKSVWHGGLINGFITMSMYLPIEDVFISVLSNCDCNSPVDITAKLAALAIGKPYQYKSISVDSSILKEYIGVYENEKGLQRIITVSGNQLLFQSGRGPKSKVLAYQRDKFYFEDDLMLSMQFKRTSKGNIEKLITYSRRTIETWNKTNKPIPSDDGIKLDRKILEVYEGVYEVTPEFSISVTIKNDRLFVEPTGQEGFEIFAESENKFFLKINDAQLEFVKDSSGKAAKVIIIQGGRRTEAKRILR